MRKNAGIAILLQGLATTLCARRGVLDAGILEDEKNIAACIEKCYENKELLQNISLLWYAEGVLLSVTEGQ